MTNAIKTAFLAGIMAVTAIALPASAERIVDGGFTFYHPDCLTGEIHCAPVIEQMTYRDLLTKGDGTLFNFTEVKILNGLDDSTVLDDIAPMNSFIALRDNQQIAAR